jgi:hypothetical protein
MIVSFVNKQTRTWSALSLNYAISVHHERRGMQRDIKISNHLTFQCGRDGEFHSLMINTCVLGVSLIRVA